VETFILPVLAVFWLLFVLRQVLAWRQADGVRRQQLKWLMAGAAVTMACTALVAIVSTLDTGNVPPAIQDAFSLATIGIAALPVSIGVAILKYRLYDIDRVISRTLAYTVLTGLLVGVYAGLVLMATRCCRSPARWRWRGQPWRWRRCSARCGTECSGSWTGGSTGPVMTRTGSCPRSRAACRTPPTWTRSGRI
jgi:hypothetical protein